MLRRLVEIDQQCLLAINGWHTDWADGLMWWISQSITWIPLYALLVGLVVWRFGICATKEVNTKRARWIKGVRNVLIILCGFAVAIGLSDYISSGLIKPWVCRLRPTHEPALSGLIHIVNGYTGGLYGFVSSHAANTMACGLLFSLLYKNKIATLGMMLWVAMNCYSRMYLGVHYLGDIIGGLFVGTLFAVGVYAILARLCGVKKVSATSCL